MNVFFRIVFLVIISTTCFAQVERNIPKSSKIDLIGGYKYFIHKVEKGQTLFYIAKAYDISVTDVIAENPGCDKDLTIGSELKVPVNKKVKYVYHLVKDGETLYSIHKQYNAQEDAILAENPDLKKGLKPGQNILVPVTSTEALRKNDMVVDPKISASAKVVAPFDSSLMHHVEKGQTMYSICQKYGVSVDDIMKLNPELNDGLKAGMDLKIPAYKKLKYQSEIVTAKETVASPKEAYSLDDELVKHVVKKNETLYSIAKDYNTTKEQLLFHNPESAYGLKEGQDIMVPKVNKRKGAEPKQTQLMSQDKIDFSKMDTVKNDCKIEANKEYEISVLMPFYLKNAGEISVSESEEKIDPINFKSFTFIGFYEGIQIALDSLKKVGAKLHIRYYDTDDDSATLKKILAKPELQKSNLIIGPFFTNGVKTAAKFAKTNRIQLVSPFALDSKVLDNNPYVIKATPSNELQMALLARYVADSAANSNIIVVYNTKSATMVNVFTSSFKHNKDFSIVDYSKEGESGLIRKLQAGKNNLVLAFVDNQIVVTTLLSDLANKSAEFSITLFGLPEWATYNSIELDYLNKLDYHSYATYHIDYNDAATMRFVAEYSNRYNGQPDRFAFAGYDLMMYFANALRNYGALNVDCLSKMRYTPLQSKYNFMGNGKDGCENKYIHIFKIEDFKIVPVQ